MQPGGFADSQADVNLSKGLLEAASDKHSMPNRDGQTQRISSSPRLRCEGRPRRVGPFPGPFAAAPLLLPLPALGPSSAAVAGLVTAAATTVVTRPALQACGQFHSAQMPLHARSCLVAVIEAATHACSRLSS